LQTDLADHKNKVAGMDATIKLRDALIAGHDAENSCSRPGSPSSNGRARSSWSAAGRGGRFRGVAEKLQEQLEANALLKADFAARAKETEQALAKAVGDQKLLESLQHGISRRDESLAGLKAELDGQRSSAVELCRAADQLLKRVDGLERGLQEHAEQGHALRDELQATNQSLRSAEDASPTVTGSSPSAPPLPSVAPRAAGGRPRATTTKRRRATRVA
jgi:hypothetical protein